jgi:hypothetical protein
MRKKETDKALEIASQIQELIYYIIPEKWKNIELYISMPDSRIRKGELFFYYLPNSIFKRQYINCYEVPYMFNISEKEYSDIMSKLYNKFMILKEELNKNNRQVEEIYVHITKTNYMMEIATDNIVLKKKDIRRNMLMLYSSYQNHIIWRYLNLNILPDEKKEKEIITRYLNSEYYNLEKEIIEFDIIDENIKSIVDFEKVLTVEEAIARSIYEKKIKEKKNSKQNENNIDELFLNDDSKLNKQRKIDEDNNENSDILNTEFENIRDDIGKNKKNIFSKIIDKLTNNEEDLEYNDNDNLDSIDYITGTNKEKERFINISKQDMDLEEYILEKTDDLWNDNIDDLEEIDKKKHKKKEKGLFD